MIKKATTKKPAAKNLARKNLATVCARFVCDTHGQDLIEYALLASTIALGVTAAMMYVRNQLNTEFSNIGNSISAGS
jgi:Flp pilus assembly pilin Flp